jgi:HEAT repeat protein
LRPKNRPSLIAAMRRTIFFPLIMWALLLGPASAVSRAAQTNETQLLEILQSGSSSLRQKADACAQLKLAGTERSVEPLAALLTDEQLSHSARHALESMQTPKAGKALRDALSRTSGLLKVGVINSLAIRHDTAAVRDLGKLLSDPDQTIAVASAEALGRIGGSAALKMLRASVATSSGALHEAGIDGILMCAASLMDEGKQTPALKLYKELYNGEKAERVREAAFRGMILASGKDGIPMAADAIINGDSSSQSAALHLASQLKGTEATRAFADLAVGAKAPIQLALIECLVLRGDPAAQPAVAELAGNADASVRLAAISALGSLGNDSNVRLLAEKAAGPAGEERNAARQALLELNHGPVTRRMLELLDPASPKLEAELIRALGGRGDQSATPGLLNLARHGNKDERTASLQALGQLADASRIPTLVELVVDADNDDTRSQAADAVNAIYQRTPGGKQDADALVKAVNSGSIETRLALLPICSELAQEPVRKALRASVADGDARIRDAGIHALCETGDPELLPDLLQLADVKNGESVRHLAIRGCVRLTSPEEGAKISKEKKLDAFTQILGGKLDVEEKRLVLSGLAGVADRRALALAVGMLDDAAVQVEAEQAVIHIAGLVRSAHPAEAGTALKKVMAISTNEENKKSARAMLEKKQ